MLHVKNSIGLLAVSLFLMACSKGGELTLAPDARIVRNKGTPRVVINQGGKALVVQDGQTPSTGVHGWVTVQTLSSHKLKDASGHRAVLAKPGVQ